MKKWIRNILFLASVIAYAIILSGFISNREHEQKIGKLVVRIVDSTENQFIRSAEIHNLLQQKQFNPFGKPSGSISLAAIERSLKTKQIISKAEVFITEPGVLHVEISQKTPFVRIFNRYGQGYYLDRQGNIIPVTRSFSPMVIVASGYISEPFAIGQALNIGEVQHDSLTRSRYTIFGVYELAGHIADDDFWNAQIAQIYVNNRYEFELIPRVGSHIIELGRAEDIGQKLENLKILYQQGFNKLGWNQYEKISLKYKNQVVCTKIQ